MADNDDLAPRLLAAIDAKAAKATTVANRAPGPWRVEDPAPGGGLPTAVWVTDSDDTGVAVVNGGYRAEFIVDNQPDDVLRRCEADRRTVERHSPRRLEPGYGHCAWCGQTWPCPDFQDRMAAYDITAEETTHG